MGLLDIPPSATRTDLSKSVTSYVGQIATRCVLMTTTNSTNKQIAGKTAHIMRGNSSRISVVFPNFYVVTNGTSAEVETGTGSAAAITASIEYPIGTITQLKFSGVAQGSIPDLSILASDYANINIPTGKLFYVHWWYSNPNGIIFNALNSGIAETNLAQGESATYGVTTPDTTLTTGQLATTAGGAFFYAPCAILGDMNYPSVALIGDSRVAGVGDSVTGNFDVGELARSIGPKLAYINLGVSADRAMYFITGHTNRVILANYCSHIVLQLGFNDITSGARTPTQVLADLATIAGYFPSKPIWLTTKEPQTSSTDGWLTVANQTKNGANGNRVTLNNDIRAFGTGGFATYATGYIEIADQFEVPLVVFTVSGVTVTPTAGAVYTNNGSTITVTAASISGGNGTVTGYVTGTARPAASGTLTKSSGTGDATITFSAFSNTNNSGLWNVNISGSYGLTSDGIHPNQTGYLQLKNNESINPVIFSQL